MLRSLLLCMAFCSSIWAQATTGTLLGTVRDASGAVIPGASVVTTNTETNVSTTWTTNAAGDYTAPFQLPGRYNVAVERTGFKKSVQTGVLVQVGDRTRVDLTLETGMVSETITATAEVPLIKTDSSEIGQVIQERPIYELPLNSATGRNFTSLMTLIPGTIRTNPVGVFDAPQGNSSFSVNGVRDSANNYMVDGADNNEVLLGIVQVLPPPEAIGEFKIQTNSYSAEFGRAGGAVVNVQTRSGSNEFHGSLFEFLRNDALDARGPFNTGSLPPLRQNEYGGTIGGPIFRNKTFFFTDVVRFQQRAGQQVQASVPTLAQRQGRFLASEGAPIIYDPSTGTPFANNTIPATQINPVAQRLVDLYPAPNLPGAVQANTGVANNYTGIVTQQQDATRMDVRIDHTLGSKDSVFGRYSLFDAFTALPPLFGNVATGALPARAGRGDSRNQNLVLGHVHTFSSTNINELRVAWMRVANSFVGYDYGNDLATQFGIPNLNIYGTVSSGLPRINIEGLSSLGTDGPIPALRYEGQVQLVDNYSLYKGRHSIKFGIDSKRYRGDFFQISLETPRGRFDFDRNYTSNNGAAGTGLGIASTLLGYPSLERRGVINDFPSNLLWQNFFYIQDDFKVNSRLTLNYGIRYELYPPAVDRHDNQSNFDIGTGQVLLANRGSNSRALVKNDLNNWAPRFGFALRVNDRNALRGGYGVSYFPDKFGSSGGTLNTNYPFITLQEITPADRYRPTPALAISNGIAPPVLPDLTQASVPLVGSITALDPNYAIGYIQFWNLTWQQQFGSSWSLDTAYVGTKGTHLFGNVHVNLNQPAPGPGNINLRRPYAGVAPLAGTINLRDSSQSSIYHSLQVKLERRITAGVFLLNSYTYAKSIDDAGTKTDLTNWRATTRGPANTDFRHNITSTTLYELPIGRGRRFGSGWSPTVDAILGGWQLNGIFTFRTGLPSTVSLTAGLVSSILNNGGSARPNTLGPAQLPKEERTIQRYFNTGAFAAPAANSYQFGNTGRNTVYGPSLANLDFSVFKVLRFAERFQLQIRGESFNMLNHPNYNNPNTQFGNTAFGTITSTSTSNRQNQVALKLLF